MEVNRTESAAVAAVGGVTADVLDSAGRLVVTPHPYKTDEQRNMPADLLPGESLAAFLERHVPGIESGAWTVSISGYVVPQAMWERTFPKHGQLIACRAVLRKSALQLVAIAALSYFSGGLAGGLYGAAGGTYVSAAAGTWLSAIQVGVFVAGSVLINKVLGPKIPSVQSQAQKQVFSLRDQRNTARPYEPIPVLWGEMRVTPDLASKAYAWYEGDDQYLSTILLGGINVHSASDLAIGDTPIGNYSDVSVYYNGFPGMPSQNVPLYSNVDAVAGAEFVNGGDWITRTGSVGAGVLQLDIEGQLYDVDGKGNTGANSVDLTIQCRPVGTGAWQQLEATTLVNATADVVRRMFSFDVAPGQYEVRAKLGVPRWNDGGSYDACKFAWVTLKSVQADTADYSQWGRIGIKIRASGQLNGGLDQVRATYRAKPMPIWTGTEWATAATRADGLSNPGAILLQTLRGVRDAQGRLQFGYGMSDEQIDIEGLKSFMLYCTARGYTYDKWVTASMSLRSFCDEVALAGMGEFSWTDGSRPTAVFVASGQSNSAVVNMANMLKGGFSVDYALSNAADGIEYQWLNRETWEMTPLRVKAPGVTTMLSPARVTGEGITSEAHAAVMARYHLAQSLYQYKTINFTADIEHLDYRRLSVLSVSHDLTQWGFGGRVMAAKRIGAQVQLTLDEPVPPLATAYIGLRVPGARDYRVWPVQPLAAESDVVTLVGEWPENLALPGEGIGNSALDTLWCYDFKSTPGYRVRVTGIDPESDLKGARVTAVPEGPEFWDYVLNGTYVPAPNQSSIPQLGRPVVKNLRVSEKVNLQGDTEWYELSCVWDVEGECDHAQVWAGRDGSELRMVDGSAQGTRSTFRIDGAGEWLIVVRPFNASGQAGQSATLIYITTMTQLPPRNPGTFVVQQVEGGLRRFAWLYAGQRPAAYAGVQIRYLPGDVPLSVANWDAMQPLGNADDVYSAQFETTKPDAGQWTFGLRAVDTAGQLANGVVRVLASLDKVFDNLISPDLTPPPAPTGLDVSTSLANIHLGWDQPKYTVGHGHQFTRVYAAQITTAQPAPGRAVAKVAAEIIGPVGSIAQALGTSWRLWFVNVTNDGVESTDAGPVDATVGKIGNSDLGPLIVEAGNLANGAVSASKIAAQAVDTTKFANGIEPVTNSSAATLPTVKSTSTITWQGKLYRWDGSKYTAAVPTGDLTGSIIASQIAAGAIDATKFAAGIEPVTNSTAASLPTVKSTTTITWQGKLYRWDGSKYTAEVPTTDLTGSIIASQIAAGAIDVAKFAAGIEPVTNSTAASLPTVKSTTVITWQGKLYRWNGSKYTAEVVVGDMVGQIAATQIADNAITTPKLAANSVVADKIAANAVVAAALAADAVTAGKIAAGAVNADQLAAGSVLASKLQIADSTNVYPDFDCVDAGFYTAVTGSYVFSASSVAINGKNIVNMPVSAAATEILSNWFSLEAAAEYFLSQRINLAAADAAGMAGAQIEFGSYPGSGSVVATRRVEIGKNGTASAAAFTLSFTTAAAERYARMVFTRDAGGAQRAFVGAPVIRRKNGGSLIVDGAISANKIAVGAVTANAIAANAVTANAVAANAITAAKIAAGAVGADQIAANSITAKHLTVADYANLIPDPDFSGIAQGTWYSLSPAVGVIERYTSATGNGVLITKLAGQTGEARVYTENWRSLQPSNFVPVKPGDMFRVICSITRKVASSDTGLYAGIYAQLLNTDGTSPAVNINGRGVIPNAVDGVIEVSGQYVVPSGTLAMRFYVTYAAGTGSGGGAIAITNMSVRRMNSAELIVDGAISANKIAVGAVTANAIAANAVTANAVAANAITAGKIAAGAVNAEQIAAKAITVEKLAVTSSDNLILNSTFENDPLSYANTVPSGWSRGVSTSANDRFYVHGNIGTGQPTERGFRLDRLAAGTAELSICMMPVNFSLAAAAKSGGVSSLPGDEFFLEWYGYQDVANVCSIEAIGINPETGAVNTTDFAMTAVSNVGVSGNMATLSSVNAIVKCQASIKLSGTLPLRLYLRFIYSTSSAGAASIFAPTLRRKNAANLIVDGSITATKLAANSIAVGTAAIQNGAIVNAMIANAAIDNAKIANLSASKITAGAMQVGSYISSANYRAGYDGWAMNSDGQAEFCQVTVRGTIVSTSGTIGGININANGLNAGSFSGWGWPASGTGFHLGPNGLLLGNYNTGKYLQLSATGELYAPGLSIANGTATFSGAINGASGTFAGTLTAAGIITTGNMKKGAITTPLYVFHSNPFNNSSVMAVVANVPAFAPGEVCSVDFGFVFQTEPNQPAACHFYVDGVNTLILPAGTQVADVRPGTFNFSYLIEGNGNARQIGFFVLQTTQVTFRYIKAIVMRA